MCRKKSQFTYIKFITIYICRHPLGVLGCIPVDKGMITVPHTGWLKTTETDRVTDLEARSQKSSCCQCLLFEDFRERSFLVSSSFGWPQVFFGL